MQVEDQPAHDNTGESEALPSKRMAKKAQKVTKKMKKVAGSVDVRVQHTNDDSVVSKRSAVALNYFHDPFLRHFVTKPTRRAPLINRGYYLRMLTMTDVVTQAINHLAAERTRDGNGGGTSTGEFEPVQILSLGAGFDTLAFRTLLAEERTDTHGSSSDNSTIRATCATVHKEHLPRLRFFDVDFPAVMQTKAALMQAAPNNPFCALKDLCIEPQDAARPVRSAQYNALGVDLRESQEVLLARLRDTAATTGFAASHPTVVYAECVMQYMPPDAARELIESIATHFPNAIFIAYDQLHPADSFGRVMLQSLRQKSSPLLGIEAAPDGQAMMRRAIRAGMAEAYFANFYHLSRHYISAEEEARLKRIEAFDELEEWAEMCEHYGITLALTSESTRRACVSARADGGGKTESAEESVLGNSAFQKLAPAADLPERGRAPDTCTVAGAAAVDVAQQPWPSSRFGFEGWGNGGGVFAETHPHDPHEVVIVSFGGFCVTGKVSQRVNAVYAHGMRLGEMRVVTAHAAAAAAGAANEGPPPPIVFHSMSRIAAYTYVVFGGRTNPECASREAYLLRVEPQRTVGGEGVVVARWHALAVRGQDGAADVASAPPLPAPSPRFRHSAVALTGGAMPCIFVCGGCDSHEFFNDAWVGTVDLEQYSIAWERCHLDEERLPAVCSASLTVLPAGKTHEGRTTQLLLAGGIDASGRCCAEITILTLSADYRRVDGMVRMPAHRLFPCGPRFSLTVTPIEVNGGDYLLVLGGCATDERGCHEPCGMITLVDASFVKPPVALERPAPCPPALARHAVVPVARGVVAVVGGGYTCFSFGTFTSRPFLLMLGSEFDKTPMWTVGGGEKDEAPRTATVVGLPPSALCENGASLLSLPRPSVEEQVYTPATFTSVAKAATRPVVFRRVDLGSCVQKWADPDYLKSAERDAVVSVHVANAKGSHLLDFVRKNFTFRHVPFPSLIDHIVESTRLAKAAGAQGGQVNRETWYFRSIAHNMKTERANLWTDFKGLGNDFSLPEGAREYVMPRLHQSCLRLNAAPLQLWTHYDTLDNVLCQVVGRKRIVLFPPSEYNNLYVSGSSSPVLNIDSPDLHQYPRFIDACKRATEVVLEPGDVLYFPANWFHHITTLIDEPTHSFSVSVNLFFEHFCSEAYDKKDLYGNRDILAVTELREKINARVKDAVAAQRIRQRPDDTAGEGEPLPVAYAQFALRQALQDLEKLADEMSLEAGLAQTHAE